VTGILESVGFDALVASPKFDIKSQNIFFTPLPGFYEFIFIYEFIFKIFIPKLVKCLFFKKKNKYWYRISISCINLKTLIKHYIWKVVTNMSTDKERELNKWINTYSMLQQLNATKNETIKRQQHQEHCLLVYCTNRTYFQLNW